MSHPVSQLLMHPAILAMMLLGGGPPLICPATLDDWPDAWWWECLPNGLECSNGGHWYPREFCEFTLDRCATRHRPVVVQPPRPDPWQPSPYYRLAPRGPVQHRANPTKKRARKKTQRARRKNRRGKR